jgi:hypothetical protein
MMRPEPIMERTPVKWGHTERCICWMSVYVGIIFYRIFLRGGHTFGSSWFCGVCEACVRRVWVDGAGVTR